MTPWENASAIETAIRDTRRVTLTGMILNVILAAVKFLAGVVGNSQALQADAIHSLSDLATDLAVYFGVRRWSAPADDCHPYGHGKIETLITLFIGQALMLVGLFLGWEGMVNLIHPLKREPSWMTIWVALFSIVSKEFIYWYTLNCGRRLKSEALIVNAWHHRTDALSSLPVLAALLGCKLDPSLHFLDPAGAVVVSAFILFAAGRVCWPALQQLAEVRAELDDPAMLPRLAKAISGVVDVHAIRARHVGSGLQLDFHLLVLPQLTVAEGHAIAHQLKQRIQEADPAIDEILIHVEPAESGPQEVQDS